MFLNCSLQLEMNFHLRDGGVDWFQYPSNINICDMFEAHAPLLVFLFLSLLLLFTFYIFFLLQGGREEIAKANFICIVSVKCPPFIWAISDPVPKLFPAHTCAHLPFPLPFPSPAWTITTTTPSPSCLATSGPFNPLFTPQP